MGRPIWGCRLVLLALVAGRLLTLPLTVHAQANGAATAADASEGAVATELDRKARLHFQQGTALFESGEYERAAEDFEEAYRLSNRPALLFNIALAYERLGQLRKAADLLRAYLTAVPDTQNRGRLELRIQRMEERAEQQHREEEQKAQAAANQQRSTPATTPTDTKIPFNWKSPAVITTAAVTLGGLIVLGVFGPLALVEKGNLEDSCSPTCSDSDTSTLRGYRLAADIGLGVAVVGAVAGTTWIVLDHKARNRSNKDQQSASRAPSVSLGMASATLRWRY